MARAETQIKDSSSEEVRMIL